MKLGILSTNTLLSFGASEEILIEICKKACERNIQCHVSIYKWNKLHYKWKEIKTQGCKLYFRKKIEFTSFFLKVYSKIVNERLNYFLLRRFLNKDFDYLVINLGGSRNLENDNILKLLEQYKGRYFIITHSASEAYDLSLNTRKKISKILARAETVYYVSKRLREIDERNYGIKVNSKIIISPLNINNITTKFIENSVVSMACVGRLENSIKGQALLIQILGQPVWKTRNWILNFYGTGKDLEYFKFLVDFYGLEGRIFFHGYVSDVTNEIWAKNHVLIMPSYREGMSLALLECMLNKRAAVITDVGGGAEVIKDGVNGFIAEAPTFFSFSNAMERMWKNKNNLERLGQQAEVDAKEYRKRGYSVDDILNSLKFQT